MVEDLQHAHTRFEIKIYAKNPARISLGRLRNRHGLRLLERRIGDATVLMLFADAPESGCEYPVQRREQSPLLRMQRRWRGPRLTC